MPFDIIRNDLSLVTADAIVNAANEQLLPGGGVCGALHRAAGPELAAACRKIGHVDTGRAVATPGFGLQCQYVIHTAGPVWQGGNGGEREKLADCYLNSLRLADGLGCKSIAFPLISSGIYGYPPDRALRVAVDAISAFLMERDMQVTLVVFTGETVALSGKVFEGIRQYIDDHYVEEHRDLRRRMVSAPRSCAPMMMECVSAPGGSLEDGLKDALNCLDETFSQMVLRKIAEKGMTNAQCYKKANLDKKLFSKIHQDADYRPKKPTAVALAVALELSLKETEELLLKAGFALSPSAKFDVIVEYFIRQGHYNIFDINEALFFYDQPLLGCTVA